MSNLSKVVLFASMLIFSANICAHPPKDIKISFNPQTKMLTAIIFHDVLLPKQHYIKTVTVEINTKKVLQHTLSEEESLITETVSYRLPDVKSGDTVSVEAECSISGKLKKDIKIN